MRKSQLSLFTDQAISDYNKRISKTIRQSRAKYKLTPYPCDDCIAEVCCNHAPLHYDDSGTELLCPQYQKQEPTKLLF